ncbi:MAG: hypothetical protein VB878_09825 [Pirellulaceae bacterium]
MVNKENVGWLLAFGLVIAWVASHSSRDSAMAQTNLRSTVTATDSLMAIPTVDNNGAQLLTVIDPVQRSMGVYQVDRATGEIALRSVRNIRWDLQMEEFNTHSPKPREIRALSEQR